MSDESDTYELEGSLANARYWHKKAERYEKALRDIGSAQCSDPRGDQGTDCGECLSCIARAALADTKEASE
jgi:hypothetical protein